MAEAQTAMTPNMLAAMAQQLGGTQAIPAVQRSQYLADALHSLQASGGQNLRTAGALGSNLLADALLQWKQQKNNQALMGQVQQGQSSMIPAASSYMAPAQAATPAGDIGPSGAGLSIGGSVGGSPPVQTSGPNATQVSSSPFGSGATPTPGVTPSAQALASALSPQDQDAAINTVYGEARGEPAAGRQAVAGVMANRAALTGLPLADIAAQPHQFAGYNAGRHLDPNSSIYKSIMTDIMPVLNGQAPNPAGTADHFYAPGAMPNGSKPSWDNGSGQMIGNQDFLSLGYGGKPALTAPQSPASGPQIAAAAPPAAVSAPPTAAGAAGPAGGQPYQVASLGTPPGPPQGGGGGVPPAGPVAPSPAAGPVPASMPQQVAQAPGGPPTGPYATPQEAAYIQERMAHPPGSQAWQQGVLKAQEIQQRRMTPMAPPKDMMWGPNGQAVPVPGTAYQTVSSGPAGVAQSDPFGQYHATSNPNAGPIPAGMMASNGPNGAQLSPMAGSQPRPLTSPQDRAAAGILPSDRNAYAMGPDGNVKKVADNPYGPKEIQSVHDNFWGSDETKKAQEAYSAYTGFKTALGNSVKNNGPLDQAAVDSFLRGINPGMGARNSTVQMVMDHFGWPDELKGKVSNIVGNGFVTPENLGQMMQIGHDYALAHQNAAQARSAADVKMVAPYGYGPADLAEDLPSLGPVPQIHFGGAGPGSGVQPPNGAQPANGGANRLFPSTLPGQASAPGAGPAPGTPAHNALLEEARRRGLIR